MLDIVCADGLEPPLGIKQLISSSRLKNFCDKNQAIEKKRKAIFYRESYEFKEGELKKLASLGSAVLLSFSDVAYQKGIRRGIVLSKMKILVEMCRRTGCRMVFATLAQEPNMLRNAKEIESFMKVVGLRPNEIEASKKSIEELCGARK
ncbi:MAG: hypothetical protein N3G80_00745 [Candidatus Micrarchaeota archaeon]|nr:hypothetical protein [Candidatus Micrarchaeota archaeon]